MRNFNMKGDQLREVIAKLTRMLAQKDIEVSQRGTQAYCSFDNVTGRVKRINLPIIPPNPSEEFINALHGYLDHEVAHALFTDPKAEQKIKKDDAGFPPHVRQALTNVVEDVRIENVMAKHFRGSLANMEATRQLVADQIWGPALDDLEKAGATDKEKASVAIVPYLRALGGHAACQEFVRARGLATLFEPLHKAIPDLEARLQAMESTADAVKLSSELLKALGPPPPPPPSGEGDNPDLSDGDKSDKSDKSSESKGAPSGDGDDDKDGDDKDGDDAGSGDDKDGDDKDGDDAGSDDGEGGEAGNDSKDNGDDERSQHEANSDEPEEKDDGSGGEGGGQLGGGSGDDTDYAPMDLDLGDLKDLDAELADKLASLYEGMFTVDIQTDFTRDYDRIEVAPSHGDFSVEPSENEVRKVVGPMQKELQRLILARSQSYNVGGYRSGRLNGAALHRLRVSDDRVFRRKVTHQTQATAISLLVDCSGSMISESKIKMAMLAAWAFADVLSKLRIPNEVLGFTTCDFPIGFDHSAYTREVVQMSNDTALPMNAIRARPNYIPIFKSFDEPFSVEQKKRMSRQMIKCDNMWGNNDALGVEYAGMRLMRRSEPRKIMIVFSDGAPSDGDVAEHIIGKTLVHNIDRFEKAGMEIIGIGIGDASVRRFYKKHIVLHNISNLPSLVMGQLKTLLLAGQK